MAALLSGIAFEAVIERTNPALSKIASAALADALKAPFSLFAERSPGARGSGALLSTKPERTAANIVPHERVLSTVRDREPPVEDAPPAADSPAVGAAPQAPATNGAFPGAGAPTSAFNTFPFLAFPAAFNSFPATQAPGAPTTSGPDGSGQPPPDQTAGTLPSTPPSSPGEPGGPIIPPNPPPGGGPPSPPPNGGPPTPPGPTDVPPPPGPGPTPVPEPQSWTMLLAGIFAIGVVVRISKRPGPAGQS